MDSDSKLCSGIIVLMNIRFLYSSDDILLKLMECVRQRTGRIRRRDDKWFFRIRIEQGSYLDIGKGKIDRKPMDVI